MALTATIESIARHLRANSYRNESDVREAIVNRVLQELGWQVYDPAAVRREFAVDKRRVDYALFASSSSPSVFIEVKAPNAGDDGDKQLFEYAFHQGVPFAVLVNGREWSFYLPAEQGSYLERRVQKLDLLEREPREAASVFERYLRVDRVKNGDAHQDARSDYQNAARIREAKAAIPRAWSDLVSEPDELLIDLIAEKVVSIIGFRPTDEQVEAFLLGLRRDEKIVERKVQSVAERSPQPVRETPKPGASRALSFRFIGQTVNKPDAISALVFVLEKLAERDPHFHEEFAKRAPGRRRNHIARNRSDVYPNKPELETYTTEIVHGWWLGTNIANREKERLVRVACEVAGLRFGKDIEIEFPHASD